jgi:pilus assembly protein CpaF
MTIFNSKSKGDALLIGEPDNAYGSYSSQDIRRLMQEVVRMLGDCLGKGIIEQGERGEDKKRAVKKNALIALRQLGYGENSLIKEQVLSELNKYLWGYYVLDELINNQEISDIRVLNWNYIRYKRFGRRYTWNESFIDVNDYIQFVNLLAVRNKKSLSDINAVTYFTDDSNERFILRFNICTSFVSSGNLPVLTIRKIPKEKYSFDDLMNKGMLDKRMVDYLKEKARNSMGILFTGKGASGKTTLLNTMLEHISRDESALVIQESDELFISSEINEKGELIPSRDIAFLHTVSYSGEGRILYTLPELTRNGLRMDLDYFIIGEIKGDEAEGFSMASYTGHKCWATVHGMNSFEGINKLADYIKQAPGYEFEDCLKKLIGMEVIIFMKEFKVCEITEVHGYDAQQKDLAKKVIYQNGRWLN